MGRWAQRRRAGGGPQTVNYIVQIDATGSPVVTATYNANIDVGEFAAANFVRNDTAAPADSVSSAGPKLLEIEFTDPVNAATSITYTGTANNVRSPQTILTV